MDVFNEYEDAEIVRASAFSRSPSPSAYLEQFEALRRVHLIPPGDEPEESEAINANVFRSLDSPVSEGGENFSTGYVRFRTEYSGY